MINKPGKMFSNIVRFEWRYWLKSPSLYIYAGVLFLLALGSMAGSAGAFGQGSSNLETIANSPWNIFSFIRFFNKLLILLVPALVGASIFKDYATKVNEILFTYAFTKTDYLFAKFFSSFFIVALLALVVVIGLAMGTCLPSVNPAQILPFDLKPYAQAYLYYLLPNLFFCSILVFTAVCLTRNLYTGFITIILVWFWKEIWFRWSGSKDSTFLTILTDPFGETLMDSITRFWTLSERNQLALPWSQSFIINRMMWTSLCLFIFFILFKWFSFGRPAWSFTLKPKSDGRLIKNNFGTLTPIRLSIPGLSFGFQYRVAVIWRQTQIELNYILRSSGFLLLLLAAVIFLVVLLQQVNPQTDTRLLSVTWKVLGLPVFFFTLLIQALTFFYAGVILHRPRAAGMTELINATPVANVMSYISGFLTLVLLQLILLGLIMLAGIGVQLYNGFSPIEPGHYIFNLMCIHLPGLIIWATLALFIQALFNNTYLGFFMLVMIWLVILNLESLGIQSQVFKFNQDPKPDFFLKYSDLSHYGDTLRAFYLYKAYWFLCGILLACLALVWWPREHAYAFRERIKMGIHRFHGRLFKVSVVLIFAWMFMGFWLFKNETLEENLTPTTTEVQMLNTFIKKYSRFQGIQQPRIRSVFIQLDLFPKNREFTAHGSYILVNPYPIGIDTLLVRSGFDENTALTASDPWTTLMDDSSYKFSIFKLNKRLEPGDTMTLHFEIKNKPNSLLIQHSNVLENGTYLKNDILPRIGYFADDPVLPTDSSHIFNHYQSRDEDLVEFETVLSTSLDQTAIAPGILIKEWVDQDRRYFHYKMDKKIKLVVGFNSGRYQVYADQYKGIELKIYHHPTHTYCLERMVDGLKSSLDFNSSYFGPYPHGDINIIEFSRAEGSYATTSGNCMPISEIRFIQDLGKTEDSQVDLAFYVAAHELTHQWWGNQVIPADAPGALLLTESITEYITAKIYEKKFGKKNALKFIDIQLNRYLQGRGQDLTTEPALRYVSPEQSYISYGKGAVILYTFSEYLGEEKFNQTLKTFFDEVKNKPPPYPTSLDFINHLKKNTPDNLVYLIKDMFETADPAISLSPYYQLFPDHK